MHRIYARTSAWAISLALLSGFAASGAAADSNMHHGHDGGHESAHMSGEAPFGMPGDPAKATRTMILSLSDAMRFDPSEVTVKRGETIRFVVANKGRLPHEMVLGTMASLKAHGAAMQAQPHAAHADPAAVRLEPGQQGELVWQFSREGEFHFACLVPGHFEAGMVGKIHVKKG